PRPDLPLSSLTRPPPPPAPPFPYPPLFRSLPSGEPSDAHRSSAWMPSLSSQPRSSPSPPEPPDARFRLPLGSPPRRGASETERRDRKSTRLNSSHVESSYAVFCLKKKKQDRIRSGMQTQLDRTDKRACQPLTLRAGKYRLKAVLHWRTTSE